MIAAALLITDDGGKLVKTPTYAPDQNRQTRTVRATVDATGAVGQLERQRIPASGGEWQSYGIGGNPSDEQKKWLQKYLVANLQHQFIFNFRQEG